MSSLPTSLVGREIFIKWPEWSGVVRYFSHKSNAFASPYILDSEQSSYGLLKWKVFDSFGYEKACFRRRLACVLNFIN